MTEQLIKDIYTAIIPILTNDLNPEEKQEMCNAYYEHISYTYSDKMKFNTDYEKLKNICIDIEKKSWTNKSVILRKKLLFKDDYYTRLIYLSDIGLKNANIRLLNEINNDNKPIEITKEIASNNMELMTQYSEMVRDFNKQDALMILSEGLLDYNYALGISDNKSFRIGK